MSLWHVLSSGVNRPFEAQGGIFRDEAIMLLRRFYIQENGRGVCLNCFLIFFCVCKTPPRTFPHFFKLGVCLGQMRLNGWLIIYMFLHFSHDNSSGAETKEKP